MAQNNPNVTHQQSPQSLGNFPSSYDQFFAGTSWPRPSQSPNPAAPLLMPSPGPMPSSSALQQPWEQQNASALRSPLNHPHGQQQAHVANMAAYQQPNAYAAPAISNPVAQYPSSHYPSMSQLQQNQQPVQLRPSNSPIAPPSVTQQSLAPKLQAYGSYQQPSAVQQKPMAYIPYSQPQQPQQQLPAYQNGSQYPEQPLQYQYPQYPSTAGFQPGVPVNQAQPSNETGASSAATPSLLSQVHQTLPDPPPAEPLPSNPNFSIINSQKLCDVTNSKMITPLLAVSQTSVELPHTKGKTFFTCETIIANMVLVAQLPRYEPRMNLLELRKIAPQDPELKCMFSLDVTHFTDLTNSTQVKIEKLDKKMRSRMITGPTVNASQFGSGPISKASPITSSEDESSESDDESDDELEIEEKAPIPASRPTDPVKGAEYDVIKAVWHSRAIYLENEVLLQRIAQFSELFYKLRDRWKFSNDALKEAKTEKEQSSLKPKVTQNRLILDVALKAAVRHGHPHILSM
jgi:hypothetical protein